MTVQVFTNVRLTLPTDCIAVGVRLAPTLQTLKYPIRPRSANDIENNKLSMLIA